MSPIKLWGWLLRPHLMITLAVAGWLRSKAYPDFDCQNCLGMPEYGCYCSIEGASAPGVGPTRTQRLARWILKRIR